MTDTAVLLCGRAGVEQPPPGAVVVADLCRDGAGAAAALRETGASRVVLGLCKGRASAALLAELRRAGAEPFGIEAVALVGRPAGEVAALLAAARARLAALPAGERGRPALNGGAISRRTLFSLAGAVAHLPVAELDQAACTGTARCGLCVSRCPVSAIAAATPNPAIDPLACTACGRCVPACPEGALRLTGASSAQVEAQLDELVPAVRGVVFACASAEAEAPPGFARVELPTLALVTTGWILQLQARGVEVRLAPCDGPCCEGVAAVEALSDRVLELAGEPRDAGPLRLVEPGATATAIRALVPAGATALLEDDAAPLGVLRVAAERCTLCNACETACPTGALRLEEQAEATTLRFAPAACVACGRCVTACPERALDVRRGLDVPHLQQDAVELVRAETETCRGCGRVLPPAAMRRRLRELLAQDAPLDLCAACAAKEAAGRAHRITIES